MLVIKKAKKVFNKEKRYLCKNCVCSHKSIKKLNN